MTSEGQKKKKKNDPDESKEATDYDRIHTLEAEVNNLGTEMSTLGAELRSEMSTLGAELRLFMQQFSGQQNTAAAGGFGQGVQFSGQQRTATPAAGGLGQEVQFSGQQRTAIPAAGGCKRLRII